MEELAALAMGVPAYEGEGLEEWDGTEIVDLHVAGDGEDVERTVELAHRLVEQGGDDAAVDVAGWAFVQAIELKASRGDG